jgi:hypothetical protein
MVLQTYKDLGKGIRPSEDMLIPMVGWFSASLQNIRLVNDINEKFFYVSKSVLLNKFMLNHKYMFLGKYPKAVKDDGKLDFYFYAIKKFFGWTDSELSKNFFDDSAEFRQVIADKFGFDNKQRKALGLGVVKSKKEVVENPKKNLGGWFG